MPRYLATAAPEYPILFMATWQYIFLHFATSRFLDPESSASLSTSASLHILLARVDKSVILILSLNVSLAFSSTSVMASFTNSLLPKILSSEYILPPARLNDLTSDQLPRLLMSPPPTYSGR